MYFAILALVDYYAVVVHNLYCVLVYLQSKKSSMESSIKAILLSQRYYEKHQKYKHLKYFSKHIVY